MRSFWRTLRSIVGERELQIGRVTVCCPFLMCGVWFVLLSWDPSGFVVIGVLASIWHELGHILCYWMFFRRFPALTISLQGIGLPIRELSLSAGQEAVLALAGPAMNFAAVGMLGWWLQQRTTVFLLSLWAANFLIGCFNLLPFPPLDGYRVFHLMWKFWSNKLHFHQK